MLRAIQIFSLLSLGFIVSMQTGCEKADPAADATATSTDDHGDHDHGDHAHADNFGGAIAELCELAGTISSSMDKDDADAAHDPLHEIGHVLEGLPELAKKEGLSDEQQSSVNQAVATLMDAYGELDAGMHGDEGKSWDDLKGEVNAAVETLTAFDHGHDHDGAEHGEDHDHDDGDHDQDQE